MKTKSFDLSSLLPENTKFPYIIGIDEVGTGCIAGPIVVAGAVLPWDFQNDVGFKDSKRFTTENARKNGCEVAKSIVTGYFVWAVNADSIEQYGAGSALSFAQKYVAQTLLESFPDALVVVDGNKEIRGVAKEQQLAVPKADALVPAVSAASIIAKHHRDEYMRKLPYPEWDFHKNKGYPTPEHLQKIKQFGVIRNVHRLNIKVVQEAQNSKGWYGCE